LKKAIGAARQSSRIATAVSGSSSLGVVGAQLQDKEQLFPQIFQSDLVKKINEERRPRQEEEKRKREQVR